MQIRTSRTGTFRLGTSRTRKVAIGALAGVVLVVQAGCGTLLHPERKGQGAGQLDASIVLLNGVGLFFFLIPGIVAFAVDLGNDTIYLPGGGGGAGDDYANASPEGGAMAAMAAMGAGSRPVAPGGTLDAATLEALIECELGVAHVLEHAALEVRAAGSTETRSMRLIALR